MSTKKKYTQILNTFNYGQYMLIEFIKAIWELKKKSKFNKLLVDVGAGALN